MNLEDRLREHLRYEPRTGALIWIKSRGPAKVGAVVGGMSKQGYLRVGFFNKQYQAHRVAWLLHTGEWPNGEIDHINGVRIDNRFNNLRDVCGSENQQNQRKPRRDNKSGFMGASLHRGGKYQAVISVNGKVKYIGLYSTPQEAGAAYLKAKRLLHSTCTI